MTDNVMSEPRSGFQISFEQVGKLLRELPRLLSGAVDEVTLRTADDRPFTFGRFRMRTPRGQILYYTMFADTMRGEVVDGAFLDDFLTRLRAQPIPAAPAGDH